MNKNRDLSILTEKQRQAYVLRQNGETFQQIAKIMNITTNAARQHCIGADRRFKEYERYNAEKEKNSMPLNLNITFGDLEFILRALEHFQRYIEGRVGRNVKTDWMGKLPYEYMLLEKLTERIYSVYTDTLKNFK